MKSPFYYENLKYKLLQAIRGEHSQMSLSKSLGYTFNQYHKWETGLKTINLEEFFELCKILDIDIFRFFETITLLDFTHFKPEEYFEKLYLKLGPNNKAELSQMLRVNPSTLYRWINGSSSPDLSVILLWFDQQTQYLNDFLLLVLGRKKFEEMFESNSSLIERRKNYSQAPYSPAIQYFFETTPYLNLKEHSDEFVCEHLNLTMEEVRNGIELLLEMNCIKLQNKIYRNNILRTDIGPMYAEESAIIGRYWTEKALNRFETANVVPNHTGEMGNMWSYRIIPVAKSIEPKIKERLSLAISDIQRMIEDCDDEPSELKIFVTHYFNAKDTP